MPPRQSTSSTENVLIAARSIDVVRAFLIVRIVVGATLCVLAVGLSWYWEWSEGLFVALVTAAVAIEGSVRWSRWQSSGVRLPIFLDITATVLAIGLSGLPDVVLVAPLTFLLVSAVLTLNRRSGFLAAGYAIIGTVALLAIEPRLFDPGLTEGQVNATAAISVMVYLTAIVSMTMTAASVVEAHKVSEEELHAKRAHLQAVVDTLPMVLFAIDTEGHFTLSEGSALNLIGLSPGQVVGMRVSDIYSDENVREAVERTLISDEAVTMESEVDGVFFSTEFRPIYDAAGLRSGAVGVSMNVTEQVLARKELETLVEAKNEFVASVSHEIRTPLTVVYGLGEELRDTAPSLPADELHELHTLLAQQAGEVAAIVEDLLVAARADMGRLVVVPEHVDIGDELETILTVLSDQRVQLDMSPVPVSAWCDQKRLRQILRNLLSNAFRHGGNTVRVAYSSEHGNALIEVMDDGPGVIAGAESSIFEPYEHSRGDMGTPASIGLGLTVSRNLARLMGGDVEYLRRDGLSVFRLTLPTVASAAPDNARPEAS